MFWRIKVTPANTKSPTIRTKSPPTAPAAIMVQKYAWFSVRLELLVSLAGGTGCTTGSTTGYITGFTWGVKKLLIVALVLITPMLPTVALSVRSVVEILIDCIRSQL